MINRKILAVGTLLLGGILLLALQYTENWVKPPPPPPELQGIIRPEFRQLEPFELTGNNGQLVTEKNFQGKWSFVSFGYMSCPDVCPMTLHTLNSVQDLHKNYAGENTENNEGNKAGQNSPEMQFFFISVDPQRDTVEKLTKYVTYFNKEFVGATTDKAGIDSFSAQFSAGYVFEPETAPGQYLVAHTSAIFLVDPLGRLVATMSWPHKAPAIVAQFNKIKAYISGSG